MAVSMRSSAASAVRPARRASVQCQAGAQKALPAALVSFAAATLLATPAFAGVVLAQPQLKKVFQADETVAAAKTTSAASPVAKAVTAPKAAPAPKAAESYSEGGSFPGGLLVLPVAVGAIGAAGFALTKVDDGFTDFFNSTIIKDSNLEGAGYEVVIKEGGVAAIKLGTKKVKAGTKKGKK